MKKILSTTILLLAIVSCVSQRKMTREEWLAAGQRKYTKIDKETLIKAAEKVLNLADASDITYSYTNNGFVASRQWLVYVVISASMGTDFWTFEVKETTDGLLATIQPSRIAGTTTAYAAPQGQASTITTPSQGMPAQGDAIYDLFWSRLDFVLGLNKQWMSCDDADKKVSDKKVWGTTDHLCNLTMKDEYPENLTEEEVDRLFKNLYYKKWGYIKKLNPQRWEEQAKKDYTLRNRTK